MLISLLLLINVTQAKFSKDVFSLPCEKLSIQMSDCKEVDYSNQFHSAKGILASVVVSHVEPTQCHPKQPVKWDHYQPRIKTGHHQIFISNIDCKKAPMSVIKSNFFCDTPGADSVRECFFQKLEAKQKFLYTIPTF